jgi:hypothetical protein
MKWIMKKQNDNKKCKKNKRDNEKVKVIMKNIKGAKICKSNKKVIIKTKKK